MVVFGEKSRRRGDRNPTLKGPEEQCASKRLGEPRSSNYYEKGGPVKRPESSPTLPSRRDSKVSSSPRSHAAAADVR